MWSNKRMRRAALFGVVGVIAAAVVVAFVRVPVDPAWLVVRGTPRVLDRHGALLAALPGDTARARIPVALESMGPWLPAVTIALEDRRFRGHGGVDLKAAGAAAWQNLRAGRVVRGGSTITQQLVKLSCETGPRTPLRKLRESIAAMKLERAAGKDRILAAYLNRLPYGNRIEGPEAAARWYFDKPASELTLAESVYLAGIPQAPTRLNPWRRSREAGAKYVRSVERLRRIGFIDAQQAERLRSETPRVGRHIPRTFAPHFVRAATSANPVADATGALPTTLDLGMQRTAEALVRLHLGWLHRNDISNAAVVVIENRSGAVRAMVGSADPARWEVNIAMAARPAGSTLKPFVYAAGIDRRLLTAATLLPDTAEACRERFPDYQPRNFSPVWHGPVRVREALGNSLNVPAVVALARVGPRRAYEDLCRWGFQFPSGLDRYGAGLILGNAEIRLLDLASAYAGLARGGLAMEPTFFPERRGAPERIVEPETAAIISDILCDNTARLQSFGPHSVLDLGRRVAVKTGTSSHFRDAWTVGFTDDHTVAVWVGNMDGRPMDDAASVDAAAPLWAALVRALCGEDRPVRDPAVAGARLVRVGVDPLTGLRAGEGGVEEWFHAGSEPTLPAASMWREIVGAQRLVLPAEYAAWCASGFNRIGAVAEVPSAGLAIESPRDGARYRLAPDLEEGQQMVPLRLSGGRADGPVTWSVNGRALPGGFDAGGAGGVWWRLERGEWEIAAVTAGGEVRSRVVVE
jgi:penicillin-binding protein 1C